jgi:hypothetical protein
MKKIFQLAMLLSVLIFFTSSCESDDLSSDSDMQEILTQNNEWIVTYFWDKDKDETHKFQEYTFLFEENGTIQALKNGVKIESGTWIVNSSSNKFIISLETSSDPLEEMNDDWLIQEKDVSIIKLRDDNDEHLEELYLEKNK